MTLSIVKPVVNGDTNTWGTKINTALDAIVTAVNDSFPSGGIMMWSGSVSSLPTGFVLCDGNNSTPNLTDRFIIGSATNSGGTHDVGDTGGANSLTLASGQLPAHTHSTGNLIASTGGAHTHTGSTSNVGNHTHNINFNQQGDSFGGTPAMSVQAGNSTKATDGAGAHSHNVSISSGGSHSHNISGNTGSQGSGTSVDNRPAYFALAFIMKV